MIATQLEDINVDADLRRMENAGSFAEKMAIVRRLFGETSRYNYEHRLMRRDGAASKNEAEQLVQRVVSGLQLTSFCISADYRLSLPYTLPDEFVEVGEFFLRDVGLEQTALYSYTNFDHAFWQFFDRLAPSVRFPTAGRLCGKTSLSMTFEKAVEYLRRRCGKSENDIMSSCPIPTLLFVDLDEEPPVRAAAMNIGQSYLRLRVNNTTELSHMSKDDLVISNIDVSIDLPEYNAIALKNRPALSGRIKESYLAFQTWRLAEIHLDSGGGVVAISPR